MKSLLETIQIAGFSLIHGEYSKKYIFFGGLQHENRG